MKKAIYKITNKVNHKIYIGQSSQPEERFKNLTCLPHYLHLGILLILLHIL